MNEKAAHITHQHVYVYPRKKKKKKKQQNTKKNARWYPQVGVNREVLHAISGFFAYKTLSEFQL